MLQTPVGIVEKFTPKVIRGWIHDPDGAPNPTVSILLNGRKVAHTTACAPVNFNGTIRNIGFARRLCQLWNYVGPKDEIQVECLGVTLPIAQYGLSFVDTTAKKSRADELFRKLDKGYVFNKYGILNLSIQRDQAWQKGITELFWELQRKLKERFDVDLQVTYGTMLGAVRDKNFIGHDNDFDTCYISKFRSARRVRRQFLKICDFLIDEGYKVLVKKTHTWVMIPGTEFKMDIFYSWFHANDEFEASYGYHGPALKRKPELFQMREVQLGNFVVHAPVAAEDMLAHFYGTEWRTPDPGFSHHGPTRKQTLRYLIPRRQVNRLFWRQFYRDHPTGAESPFAQFVAARLQPGTLIFECGSGNGRDALFFAARGFQVVASEACKEGVEQARKAAAARGLEKACKLRRVDVGKEAELRKFFAHPRMAWSREKGRPVALYLRFVLHNISLAEEATLLRIAAEVLPPGSSIYLEFKTHADKSRAARKAYRNRFRRFLDPQKVARRMREDYGLTLEMKAVAKGWSPYKGTDPELCRMIAVTKKSAQPAADASKAAAKSGLVAKLRGLFGG